MRQGNGETRDRFHGSKEEKGAFFHERLSVVVENLRRPIEDMHREFPSLLSTEYLCCNSIPWRCVCVEQPMLIVE